VAVYRLAAINTVNSCGTIIDNSFGDYSDMAAIQDEAAIENGRHAELIKVLNKEKI
jgi:hypothetical protein